MNKKLFSIICPVYNEQDNILMFHDRINKVTMALADRYYLGKRELIQLGALAQRQWEPPFIGGDNRKLRQLGCHLNYSLHDGLMETITWWKNA